FEVHRPLYDWVLEQLDLPRPPPHQYEFARLNLTHTVMSKRKLLALVREGRVRGWDDPRMPTLSGLRRRGVPPEAIREFCARIGVTRYEGVVEMALFEDTLRGVLNRRAARRFGVLRPLRVVLLNYPEGRTETVEAVNNPEDPAAGTRPLPFCRELWIEETDFMEEPPPKYFRLRPGGEVRLKYAYIIRCEEAVKDEEGRVKELRCSVDLGSKRGGPTAGRKVKGTIHWVSARHAADAEVRLYDRLFRAPHPEQEEGELADQINAQSLTTLRAKVEPSLAEATPGEPYQFERIGYFCADPDGEPGRPVFNRTVTLRDSWAKMARK
ncbi:MAG: glutamine--tRNA ligase, partial [Verrucomicrobia bacterium]|nr:glutamine--tRNA ligase [Verrucomicrobiota bacterium]